jgi:hypothetical protein
MSVLQQFITISATPTVTSRKMEVNQKACRTRAGKSARAGYQCPGSSLLLREGS